MNTDNDQIQEIQEAIQKHAKYLKLAFLAAIVELKSQIENDPALVYAIENRNPDQIIQAVNIDNLDNLIHGIGMDKSNMIFSDESRDAFVAGAMIALFSLSVETQKLFNFNPLNERAAAFVQQYSSSAALELVTNTKAGIRQALTATMADNAVTEAGIKDALQIIGLTSDQTTALMNFRSQLEARKNLGFTSPSERRISEVDQILINQHMKGTALSKVQIDGLVNRYYESLLNKRANDIATTEATRVINNGQQELWQQGLDSGALSNSTHRKYWRTVGDKKVRPTHRVIPAMNPQGVMIDGYFNTPHGYVKSPGDNNSGFINCRCCTVVLKTI